MIPPVKAGDSIKRALTARTFNQIIRPQKTRPRPAIVKKQHIPVTVKGVGVDVARYRPVNIVGPVLTNEEDGELFNEYYDYPMCTVTTTLTNKGWGVTQAPINIRSPGEVVLLGLTWVYADVTDLEHPCLKVEDGLLVSGETGKATIITYPAAVGEGYCLVLLGSPTPTEVQTVITALQVTETHVQYKERDLLVYADEEETDWINLPSVVCPEVPE